MEYLKQGKSGAEKKAVEEEIAVNVSEILQTIEMGGDKAIEICLGAKKANFINSSI